MRKIFLTINIGLVIGIIGGLLGVGGGEFRLPILIGFFNFTVFQALPTNLIIGTLISIVSFIRRYSMMTPESFSIALVMSTSSMLGSYYGASLVGKVKKEWLHNALLIFLTVIGLKFILASFIHLPIPAPHLTGIVLFIALGVGGFFVGILSGFFGVAGGEVRIPLLLFLTSLTIKAAGTVNALVSIFAQVVGIIKHRKITKITRECVITGLVMAVASIIGSFIGATLVFYVDEKILGFLLGLVLIAATVITYVKLYSRAQTEH